MSILNFQPLREVEQDSLMMRILLHGDSGSGKTTAASTAPKPCFLLTEPNGLLSIRAANPDAIVIDAVSTAAAKGVPPMQVVREFFVAAMDGTIAATGAKTVVIDSLTELQRMLRDEINSTKRAGPNGEFRWTLEDWSILTDRMRKLVRTIRDLPFHVVCICLSDTDVDETGARWIVPSFQGKKLPNEIAGYFNVVGYVFRRTETQEDGNSVLMHRVLLRGASNYLTKSLPALSSIEEPKLDSWVERVTQNGQPKANLEKPVAVSAEDPKEAAPKRRTRRSRAKKVETTSSEGENE